MKAEEFKGRLIEKSNKDYGLCCPPIEAQEAVDILIEHFLGKDWYVAMPMCVEQVNSEAIYEILKQNKK